MHCFLLSLVGASVFFVAQDIPRERSVCVRSVGHDLVVCFVTTG